MKTYKVLEAHQGDKAYTPDHPELGTRIADENDVGHLVKLGLLEEIGDAPDVPEPVDEAALVVTGLRDRITTLTQELADARAQLGTVANLEADLTAARDQVAGLTADRDRLSDELAAAKAPAPAIDQPNPEPAPAGSGRGQKAKN